MQRTEQSVRPGTGGIVEALPSPRAGVALGALGVVGVLGYAVVAGHGLRQGILYGLGVLLGVALYHARFGFTSAFRQLVAVGQGAGLRAHMLMLAVASVIFAPLLAAGTGFLGAEVVGSVAPLGLSVVFGAFMFGIGMQLGGACASGTLFSIGGGQTAILLTLAGFVGGSVLGAWHWGFWTQDAFTWAAISLSEQFGYTGALVLQLAFIGLVVLATMLISRWRRPPEVAPKPSASGISRAVRGTWPLWVGALALAALNGATLYVKGEPWGVTSAFALWGSKLAAVLGIDVASWTYWSGDNAAALDAPLLADVTTVMDFGIILGAMAAAAIGGTFAVHRRIPWRTAVAAIVGGILMGYGARLAYGCNIGAYFGGVASFSLHGWLWAAMALLGTYGGLKLRPLFGLSVPRPDDSRC